jgi:hypothetical protein
MGTMKPANSILDQSFRYVPSMSTSVAETWRRFGWRPMSDEDRKRRRVTMTHKWRTPWLETGRI